jgi:hypothetical protein
MTTESSHRKADIFDAVNVKPGSDTWTGDAPAEVADQAEFFREHGFLVMRDRVMPDHLADLDRELNRIAAAHETLKPVREGFSTEDPAKWPDPQTPVFRKIGGIYDHSAAFQRLCVNDDVMRFLTEFYGPVIELYRDVVMMKQPLIGREKPWHQDAVYWPYEPNEFISATVALDSATLENGVLQVVPGSHLDGALPHRGAELQVDLTPELQERTINVPMEPGDILMFHSLILHASEPNRSDRQRRLCIFSYMAPHFTFCGEGKDPQQRITIYQSA